MDDLRRRQEQARSSRKEKKCTQACSIQQAFIADMVRSVDRQGEVLIWCRKSFGLCATRNGIKTDDLLQARESGHRRTWTDAEKYSGSSRRQNSC